MPENAAPAWDENYITREGKLFEAGDYSASHNGFSMTPAELKAAADAFTEVPNELEHFHTWGLKSILDGHLGGLKSVWLGEDGASLYGRVETPEWLDRLHRKAGGKVSLVFDPKAKTILKNGLVLRPHVKDAAVFGEFGAAHPDAAATFAEVMPDAVRDILDSEDPAEPEPAEPPAVEPGPAPESPPPASFADLWTAATAAAFAAHPAAFAGHTMHGQMLLQSVHDTAARGGAICKDKDGRAAFTTPKEAAHVQRIHDAACAGGAECRLMPAAAKVEAHGGMGGFGRAFAAFTKRKAHGKATDAHQGIHDRIMAVWPGACAGGSPPADADPDDPPAAMSDVPAAFADHIEQWKALRSIHKVTTEHGAVCPGSPPKPAAMSAGGKPPLNRRLRMLDYDKLDWAAFDRAGEELPADPSPADKARLVKAAPKELFAAFAAEPEDKYAAFAADPKFKAELEARDARIAALEQRDADARRAEVRERSVAFAEAAQKQIGCNLKTKTILAEVMRKALELNGQGEAALVTFSDAGTDTQVTFADALAALVAGLPVNPMTVNAIDPSKPLKPGDRIVFNEVAAPDPNGPISADRRKQLLGMGTLGPAALKAAH